MKPFDVLREVIYPLTDMAVLLAILGFAVLAALARAGGLFGLWLALIILPAFFRYALYLLEARADGKEAPPPGIEMFSWAENFWSLFPLVFLAFAIWAGIFVFTRFSPGAALWVPGLLFLLYPASIAVLGVTRSPLGSLNPRNLYHMIRLCGRDYLWIPLVLIVVSLVLKFLLDADLWGIVLNIAIAYAFFLLFTLTGAVLQANQITDQIEIEAPLESSAAELADELQKERRKIANHAYGFVSRGNREGGLLHIRQWLGKEADVSDAGNWFFHEMLTWESQEAALFFAQEYFAHLLSEEKEPEALKLISRCLHEDARWKPLQRDREAALQLAARYHRDDLLKQLTT